MKIISYLQLNFFSSQTGNEPVKDWLKQLPKEERKTIGVDLKKVQLHWPIGKPLIGALGKRIMGS